MRVISMLGLAVGLTVMWVLGAAPAAAAGVPAAKPLRLAVAAVPHTSAVLIAEAQGYFAAEGLAVKVQHHPLGRICLEKVFAGEADVATTADVPIMLASFKRQDFSVLASISQSGRENRLVVRQDRGIASPSDLRGKRIGILPGTGGHYFFDTLLLFHGLQRQDIVEVKLDPRDPAAALVRGEVDAAALFGTQVVRALQALGGNARTLDGPGFFAQSFNLVSAAGPSQISDEEAGKLLRAVARGNELLRNDPARALAIVARVLKVTPAELTEVWDNFDFRLNLAQSLITGLEGQARWALRSGLVPPGLPMPDFLAMVRQQPLTHVNARAVRIIGR